MPRISRSIGARARSVLGPDTAGAVQGMTALLVSSAGDLLAGLTLGAITHTLEQLPGLLVLVPVAGSVLDRVNGSVPIGSVAEPGAMSNAWTELAGVRSRS